MSRRSTHDELGDQQQAADAAEERRLFYVAMTRARERLILSGAARARQRLVARAAPAPRSVGSRRRSCRTSRPRVDDGSGVADGVRVRVRLRRRSRTGRRPAEAPTASGAALAACRGRAQPPPGTASARCRSLSYTSLATYARCGYRFYAERVLGLPPSRPTRAAARQRGRGPRRDAHPRRARERSCTRCSSGSTSGGRCRPCRRGDRRGRPPAPSAREATEIAALVERFAASELCRAARRARPACAASSAFAFPLGETLITGALDVIAREPRRGCWSSTTRPTGSRARTRRSWSSASTATQRLIYALAALRAGARRVEVAHVFLEAPDRPVTARYERRRRGALERELAELAAGVLTREFAVTETPHRELCQGCPAEGGLCSWPLEMTRRERARHAVLSAASEPGERAASRRPRPLARPVGRALALMLEVDVDLLDFAALLDLRRAPSASARRRARRRPEQAARLQLAREHDVDLRGVQRHLRAEVEPHQQPDARARTARRRCSRGLNDVVDVDAAEDLQDLPERRRRPRRRSTGSASAPSRDVSNRKAASEQRRSSRAARAAIAGDLPRRSAGSAGDETGA